MDTNLHTIFELERRLFFFNKQDYEAILAVHFIEVDECGQIISKDKRLKQLEQIQPCSIIQCIISNFKSKDITPTIVHTIYKTTSVETGEQLIRSSIWQLQKNRWQQVFHQKTKLK